MQNRQIDSKINKQVLVETGLHNIVKIEAAKARMKIKELVEYALVEYLQVKKEQK